jgi:hypothetical protein
MYVISLFGDEGIAESHIPPFHDSSIASFSRKLDPEDIYFAVKVVILCL